MKTKTGKQQSIWSLPFIILMIMGLFDQMSFMMLRTLMTKYALTIGIAEGAAAVLISVMSIAALVMRPVAGGLVDRLNNKWLLLVSYLCEVGVMLLYFVAKSYATLMLVRILNGVFYSITTVATVTVAGSLLPEEKMGSGIGLFGMGMVFSIAFAAALGQLIFDHFGANGMFLAGLFCMAACLVLTLTLPNARRVQSKKAQSLRERLTGLLAKEALPASVLNFLFCLSYAVVGAYLLVYLDARTAAGMGIGTAGAFYIVWGVVLFVVRPVAGRLYDKFGLVPVEILTILCYGACTVLLALADAPAVLYIAAAVGSFGFGGSSPALQAHAFNAVGPERKGAANSTQQIGGDLGNAIGAAIYGGLFGVFSKSMDTLASYQMLFAVAVVPMVVAMVIVLVMKLRKKA